MDERPVLINLLGTLITRLLYRELTLQNELDGMAQQVLSFMRLKKEGECPNEYRPDHWSGSDEHLPDIPPCGGWICQNLGKEI